MARRYEVYRGINEWALRWATQLGAGDLLAKRKDWALMPKGKSSLHSDDDRNIGTRGYSSFLVVSRQHIRMKTTERKARLSKPTDPVLIHAPRPAGILLSDRVGRLLRETWKAKLELLSGALLRPTRAFQSIDTSGFF